METSIIYIKINTINSESNRMFEVENLSPTL